MKLFKSLALLLVIAMFSFSFVQLSHTSNVTKTPCTQCFTVTYSGNTVSNAVIDIFDSNNTKVASCTTANNPPQCCVDLEPGNYNAKATFSQGVVDHHGSASFTACNTPTVNITVY